MYDITRNTDKSSASAALTNINSAGRWLALGGVYHGGIQVPGLAFSLLSSAQPHSRSAMQCGWGPGVWRGVVLRLHGDSWHWRLLLHAETEPNVRGDCCSRVLERGSRSAPAVRSCRDGKSAGTPSGRASRLAKRGSAPLRCATSPGAGSWDDLPGTAPNALACRAQVKLLIRRLQVGYAPRSPCCAALPGASAALRASQSEWPGNRYTLLKRNCNHFVEALAGELGVEVPGVPHAPSRSCVTARCAPLPQGTRSQQRYTAAQGG